MSTKIALALAFAFAVIQAVPAAASVQLDQEQAIAIRKLDATSHLPLQHGQLMPQHSVLRLKPGLRLERRGEQRQ